MTIRQLLKLHPTPWRTGKGDHWSREIRDANGQDVAWCGQVGGQAVAAAIVRFVNAAAKARKP